MKLPHSAALALVGWYLMTPPFQAGALMSDAPLSAWSQADAFDTASACNVPKVALQKAAHAPGAAERTARGYAKDHPNVTVPPMPWSKMTEATDSAECIATDDPRLKEKRPR